MPGENPVPVKPEPDAVKHEQDLPMTKSEAELAAKLAEREAYIANYDERGVSYAHCVDVNKRCHERIEDLETSLAGQSRVGEQDRSDQAAVSSGTIRTEPGTEAQVAVREPSEQGEVFDGPSPLEAVHPIVCYRGKKYYDYYQPGQPDPQRPNGKSKVAKRSAQSDVHGESLQHDAPNRAHGPGRATDSPTLQILKNQSPALNTVGLPADASYSGVTPLPLETTNLSTLLRGLDQQLPGQASLNPCGAEQVASLGPGVGTAAEQESRSQTGPDAGPTPGMADTRPRGQVKPTHIPKRRGPPPRPAPV